MPDVFVSSQEKNDDSPIKPSDTLGMVKKEDIASDDGIPFNKRKSRKVSPLLAFAYMPKNVNFITKEPKEKVVLLLRKHPITNLGWMFVATLMVFAPALLGYFPILEFLPENFKFVAMLFWYLIATAYVLESFLTWFFNVYIVTDERVIDIDFHNIIYREITDANIDRIQDTTTKMGSVIRTIFNYGDVLIQTASEIPQIRFEAVPRPDDIAKILNQLRIEEEREKIEGRVS